MADVVGTLSVAGVRRPVAKRAVRGSTPRRREPDIVVLDLGLPDLDGLDVCRQLRSWFHNPIIVVSADGDEDRKVAALDEGADDYVTKPFSMPELIPVWGPRRPPELVASASIPQCRGRRHARRYRGAARSTSRAAGSR